MTNSLCILYIKQKLFPGYIYKRTFESMHYASTKKSIQKESEVSFCANMLLVGKLKRVSLAEQVLNGSGARLDQKQSSIFTQESYSTINMK